jgi:flagellar basal body-associated protein FliL
VCNQPGHDLQNLEKNLGAEHGKPSAPGDNEISKNTSHFGLEEILVNISEGAAKSDRGVIHTLGLKIDLELFSDDFRSSIEKNQPALRNTIIEVANMQELEKLNTLAGKLYFKELLVSKMNAQLKQVAVRDLHFSTFFLK